MCVVAGGVVVCLHLVLSFLYFKVGSEAYVLLCCSFSSVDT